MGPVQESDRGGVFVGGEGYFVGSRACWFHRINLVEALYLLRWGER